VGGSIFIAGTGAIVTNRTLFHEARLADAMRLSNPAYANRLNELTHAYGAIASARERLRWRAAPSTGNSTGKPPLGYVDIYRMLAWMSLAMVVCALLLNKNKPGEGAPSGEVG